MRYQVSLDDLDLSNVSHLIRITDVIELQPDLTSDTKERLGAAGSYLVRSHLKARKVRVQLALLTSDITERTAVLSEVTAWAVRGKFLKIGDRPGQQLRVEVHLRQLHPHAQVQVPREAADARLIGLPLPAGHLPAGRVEVHGLPVHRVAVVGDAQVPHSGVVLRHDHIVIGRGGVPGDLRVNVIIRQKGHESANHFRKCWV